MTSGPRLYTTAAAAVAAATTAIKYRPVAGVILKRSPVGPTINVVENVHSLDRKPHEPIYLLVRKPRKHHAWQFPQGGIEPGESVTEAALRELREECGEDLEAGMITGPCGVYQYPFPPSFGKKRNWAFIGAKVEFVQAEWVRGQCKPDQNEIIDFAWLTKDEIADFVAPEYNQAIKSFLRD